MSAKRSKSPSAYRKACDICQKPRDVLVRCRIDETQRWHFVCTGSCWKGVSDGVVDGTENTPAYKYGGMWKNRHAGVSAKKPKNRHQSSIYDWSETHAHYVQNDKVKHDNKVWICRRSHDATDQTAPGKGYTYWKEVISSLPVEKVLDKCPVGSD